MQLATYGNFCSELQYQSDDRVMIRQAVTQECTVARFASDKLLHSSLAVTLHACSHILAEPDRAIIVKYLNALI